MPLSYAQYAGNGSTTTFSVPFPYLLKAHVKLYTGFSILSGTYTSLLVDGTDYTWTSSTQVQLSAAPANGVTLTVIRDTPDSSQLVPWQDGSNLIAEDLNIADLQNLYVVQEQQDRNDAGITQSTAAAAAATAATTAANTATSTANAATSTANTALSTANTALSTANTASTNASAAVSTANTASSNASAAVTTANAASATANTASTNASNAVTTANAASAAAASATTTANTAASNASTALSTANTASSNAAAAVSTANTASTNASNAVSTANTASSNASTALSTANTAASNASAAVTTANAADTKATAAIAAVSSSINYTPVTNVASIPASPANNTYIEIADSTGLESFTPLTGKPAGYIGDPGLTARLKYTTTGNTWQWLNYYANDSDARFLKKSGGAMTGPITLSGAPSSNLHAATKQYVDGNVSALQGEIGTVSTAAAAAQSTANTAVTNAAAAQSTANTAVSNAAAAQSTANSASSAAAAAQSTANTAVSNAAVAQSTANTAVSDAAAAQGTANAALPKSGGTMAGAIGFAVGQTFPTAGIASGSTSAPGIVQLSDSTSSSSSATAATSAAVKATYDFASVVSSTANAALPKSGGTISGNVDNSSTGYFDLPAGTTAQRPVTPNAGMVRFNTDLTQFEGYNGSGWGGIGALSGRNRIINGDMRIDQRNAGAAQGTTSYGLDRWNQEWSSTGVTLSWQQVTDAPTGFSHSLRVTVSTGNASFTNSASVFQPIEGFNFSDLAFGTASARAITISFWVKSSLTGSFGGVVRNSDYGQCYPFVYTVNAANTWEYKTVTIPGSTSGTWATNNTLGAVLTFGLGAVSDRKATANTWASSVARQPTGTVDLIATTGATWQVTGVQLEAGSVATPFERRQYGQELALCMRYYQIPVGIPSRPVGFDSYYNIGSFPFQLRVPMRANPTVSTSGNFTGTPNNNVGPYYNFALVSASANADVVILNVGYTNGKTLDTAGVCWNSPTIFASAEL